MKREQAKKLLPIIQAYAEGKTVQHKVDDKWYDLSDPNFVCFDAKLYRIKPEETLSESTDTFRCWKCGRTLPISERSDTTVYMSQPPKYACKSCEGIKEERYNEIFKLKKMLEENHIPFEWIEHNDFRGGYHICYPEKGGKCVCSVIEHSFSYGNDKDLLEIMGLLTPEEEKDDSVLGNLTADNVFSRISEHWKKVNTPSYRPFMDSAELILEWERKTNLVISSLREPTIWVKYKHDDVRRLVTCFYENSVELGNNTNPITMQKLFEMYTFLDGTPCGVVDV